MDITTQFAYDKIEVPPRCRLPRRVSYKDGEITVAIPEIQSVDAPIALRMATEWISKPVENPTQAQIAAARSGQSINFVHYNTYRSYDSEEIKVASVDYSDDTPLEWMEYRWWNDRLYMSWDNGYCAHEPGSHLGKPGEDPRSTWRTFRSMNLLEDEARSSIEDFYKQFVIIDGETYRETSEPMLVIMTFGLGCNHGGTSLSVTSHYNSNIPFNSYCNLKEWEQAIKAAEAVALARGDDKSVPCKLKPFEILIPESLKADPAKDYGGKGDEFINRIEGMISVAKSPIVAGLMVCGEILSAERAYPI